MIPVFFERGDIEPHLIVPRRLFHRLHDTLVQPRRPLIDGMDRNACCATAQQGYRNESRKKSNPHSHHSPLQL